jgi:hypothetical protein
MVFMRGGERIEAMVLILLGLRTISWSGDVFCGLDGEELNLLSDIFVVLRFESGCFLGGEMDAVLKRRTGMIVLVRLSKIRSVLRFFPGCKQRKQRDGTSTLLLEGMESHHLGNSHPLERRCLFAVC